MDVEKISMKLKYLELLYIPSFFLTHASVFLGISPVYAIVLVIISAIVSLTMFLRREVNSGVVEALIVAGLFYSNLIPPWSGVFFMLMLIVLPDGFANYSRFSFAFRGVAFPILTAAFLSGWNAFGLATLIYLATLLTLSYRNRGAKRIKVKAPEVRNIVHEAGED